MPCDVMLALSNDGYSVVMIVFPQSPVMALSQLKMTEPAPDFKGTAVVDGDFKTISLSDYKGKYLVFFFYPLDL